jgi:hypothetical protein
MAGESEFNERFLNMKVGEEIHMFVANDGTLIIDPETVKAIDNGS